MHVAIISDIHGNAVALDAVLADIRARSADQIVCLGDAIQGGPQPAEATARLRELACPIVMGNTDDWLIARSSPAPRERVFEYLSGRARALGDDLWYIHIVVDRARLSCGGPRSLTPPHQVCC